MNMRLHFGRLYTGEFAYRCNSYENASFTLDTYTHITTDMQKNAAIIVGNFIDNIIGGVENG